MLRFNDVSIARNTRIVLSRVVCTAQTNDFIIVMGQNGAGKTTLFDALLGDAPVCSGKILLDGIDVTMTPTHMRHVLVGRLAQDPSDNCIPSMTVRQNFALALMKGRRAQLRHAESALDQQRIQSLCDLFDVQIASVLDVPMGSLSGGQRQMLSLVMILLTRPRVLLLDEPTAALDPQAATRLLRGINRIWQQQATTILMITHDPEIARHLGNRIWVVKDGTIGRIFDEQEKQTVSASELVGAIDYRLIQ